ncbi:Uncharacterised protein [uncultured archaeon]|nr:Uncharacterised protein [uncultured archaeon]
MTKNNDQRCYDCPDGSCDSKKAEWCEIKLKTQITKLEEQVEFYKAEWENAKDCRITPESFNLKVEDASGKLLVFHADTSSIPAWMGTFKEYLSKKLKEAGKPDIVGIVLLRESSSLELLGDEDLLRIGLKRVESQ